MQFTCTHWELTPLAPSFIARSLTNLPQLLSITRIMRIIASDSISICIYALVFFLFAQRKYWKQEREISYDKSKLLYPNNFGLTYFWVFLGEIYVKMQSFFRLFNFIYDWLFLCYRFRICISWNFTFDVVKIFIGNFDLFNLFLNFFSAYFQPIFNLFPTYFQPISNLFINPSYMKYFTHNNDIAWLLTHPLT